MNVLAVIDEADAVFSPGETEDSEAILLRALNEYSGPRDSVDREALISRLIFVMGFAEPSKWSEVERLCGQREELWPGAFTKLQTGMMFLWSKRDYDRAVPALREAVETGRTQNKKYDTVVVYQALAMLGYSLLKLGRQGEAVEALGEIEAMIPSRVVVGDETSFLEAMVEQGLALDRVAKLAGILAPVSRDEAFRERLKLVTERASALVSRPLNE